MRDGRRGKVGAAARDAAAPAATPTTVQLYRDGQPFGDPFDLPVVGDVPNSTPIGSLGPSPGSAPVERPIAAADTGHHYQVRAVLPEGNLALSNVTWVPPSRQTLSLSVDAMPWASVRVLDSQTGQPVSESTYTTPTVLNLPVGTYALEFIHPEYGATTRAVTVEPGSDPQVRVVMPGFDAGAIARELLGPPPRAQ